MTKNKQKFQDDNRLRAYIACQSPKFNTVRDFWRMVWQENVELIIMATNFIENEIVIFISVTKKFKKMFFVCRGCVLNTGHKTKNLLLNMAQLLLNL